MGGCVQFQNGSKKDVLVWLDDKPPCLDKNYDKCVQGKEDWSKSDAKFFIYTDKNTKKPLQPSRKYTLEPGQTWSIQFPKNESGIIEYCLTDPGGGKVCTGSGAYITNPGIKMDNPGNVLRIEFSVNNNDIYYNLSAVDGVNSNVIVEYTGEGCQNSRTECLLNFDKCPFKTKDKVDPNMNTCSSLIGNCKGCPDEGDCITRAGCGFNDMPTKCECHKFWQTNPCALKWDNYIHKSPERCDVYSWAYDEVKITDPANCDCSSYSDQGNDKCPVKENPFKPLRQCKMTPSGNLNVLILDVM
jgi:hypothetical protein